VITANEVLATIADDVLIEKTESNIEKIVDGLWVPQRFSILACPPEDFRSARTGRGQMEQAGTKKGTGPA